MIIITTAHIEKPYIYYNTRLSHVLIIHQKLLTDKFWFLYCMLEYAVGGLRERKDGTKIATSWELGF